MAHPGYPPEDPQQMPPQSPAYPAYPPAAPAPSWPASTPPYATSGAPPYATSGAYGQPPPAGGRAPTLVLVVVAVALFLLAGVMTGLYVAKSNQLGDTRETLNGQVADRDKTIKTNQDKITQLETDNKTANDELGKNKQDLTDVTKERDALLPCMRRFLEALDAAGAGNDSALDTALRQARTACENAQGAVDS
jgi:outer membrane murein-binding lipoprotein Lpp